MGSLSRTLRCALIALCVLAMAFADNPANGSGPKGEDAKGGTPPEAAKPPAETKPSPAPVGPKGANVGLKRLGINMDRHVLRFKSDQTFKIAQFTDLHMGEPGGEEKDANTRKVMKTVLETEPDIDLVMFSGDQVSGMKWNGTEHWVAQLWPQVMAEVLEKNVPYVFINGNHDTMADVNADELLKLDREQSPPFLSKMQQAHKPRPGMLGSSSSRTNFWIPILSNHSAVVAAYLWGLDSESLGCLSQFTREAPALAFVHIPPEEIIAMWNKNEDSLKGTKGQKTECALLNNGVFSALKTIGVQSIYSGHDHTNDFLGYYQGVRLAHGRKTGYGSTGPLPSKKHGARIILLKENESTADAETWIRNENGEREEDGPKAGDVQESQYTCPELKSEEVVAKSVERMKNAGITDDKGKLRRINMLGDGMQGRFMDIDIAGRAANNMNIHVPGGRLFPRESFRNKLGSHFNRPGMPSFPGMGKPDGPGGPKAGALKPKGPNRGGAKNFPAGKNPQNTKEAVMIAEQHMRTHNNNRVHNVKNMLDSTKQKHDQRDKNANVNANSEPNKEETKEDGKPAEEMHAKPAPEESSKQSGDSGDDHKDDRKDEHKAPEGGADKPPEEEKKDDKGTPANESEGKPAGETPK